MARRPKKRQSKTAKATSVATIPKVRKQVSKNPPSTALVWLHLQKWTRFTALWLASYVILVSFFVRTIMRQDAFLEIFPHELLFPLIMHAFTSLLVVVVLYWLPWLRTFLAKLIAVLILSLFVMTYDTNLQATAGLIRAFTPGMTSTEGLPLVSVVYLILLVCLSVVIATGVHARIQRSQHIKAKDTQLAIVVLVGYLCILPTFSFARVLPAMIRESHVQPPAYARPAKTSVEGDKPDIYYIVLDRYTNADTLKKQFNYDNTPFTGFLRGNDFVVNDTAHANYPYTTMSISSTLNANYTNKLVQPFKDADVQSRTLYHNSIWQSSVVKALKGAGYQYQLVGSTYGTSYKAPLAERDYMANNILTVFGREKRLRGIEALQFANSPYYRFAQTKQAKWWPLKIETSTGVDDIRAQLATLNNIATEKPGGRFIFAHMLIPHDPFLFNGDGSLSIYTDGDNIGKPVKQKYTNQVTFINSQMQELVSTIQKQTDGKAVIIFNADEGPYPQVLNGTFQSPSGINTAEGAVGTGENMTTWSDNWLQMKFGILQAAHIPRATEDDLANLSSVNLFRIILNRYAGYSLGYLPECHYGLVGGSHNEYQYADITNRLLANTDKHCAMMQSLPADKK
jgi:hypothetical protein